MRKSLLVLGTAIALSLSLAGCGGSDGSAGPPGAAGAPGAPGAAGPAGPAGPAGSAAVVLTPTTPPAEFAALDLAATVTSVTIASPPVVNFKLATKQGVPVVGFGSTSKSATATVASYPNLAFSLAKLVPGSGGTPSKWVSYIVTTVPTTTAAATAVGLTRPSTDNTGTLVDNKDGIVHVHVLPRHPGHQGRPVRRDDRTAAPNNKADLGDLTYDPSADAPPDDPDLGQRAGHGHQHAERRADDRRGVPMRTPVDVIYDFVPATGQPRPRARTARWSRTSNCKSCHSTLGGIPGGDESSAARLPRRQPQQRRVLRRLPHRPAQVWPRRKRRTTRRRGRSRGSTYVVDGRAVGDLPNIIHKTHLAAVTGARPGLRLRRRAVQPGRVSAGHPQLRQVPRLGATTGDAAGRQLGRPTPNRLACGACHDGINFDTGLGVTLADRQPA